MKKWLSALLALAMVFTFLPDLSMGASAEGETKQHSLGHVWSGHDYEYPTYEQAKAALPGLKTASRLPASFDGRSMQTSVKNQENNGLCWAFATTAALESNMKKNGMGEHDFSEMHLGYSASTYTYNGRRVNQDQGFGNDAIYNGGYREMAAAYFMRGTSLSGAVNESEDKYDGNEWDAHRDPAITASKHKVYNAEDVMYLTGRSVPNEEQVELIKNALMTYGGLDSSMHWEDGAYNESKAAFYYTGSGWANHEVLLVGWDDNFSRTKFNSGSQPKNNGAWLVKNSWGDDWGDGSGYFWISYEDTCYPIEVSVFTGAEPWTSDMYMYETEYTSTGESIGSGSYAEYAKVFPVKGADQVIDSVRFEIPSGGAITASVDVIPSFAGFKGYSFEAKGTKLIAYPGWYTVKLDAPIRIASGGSFAVVVRLEGTGKIGYDDNSLNGMGAVKTYRRASASDSFTTIAGEHDTKNNICIKAIARTSPFTATPAISGSVKASGELTATLTAPGNARLFAVSYETGRIVDLRSISLKKDYIGETLTLQLKAGSRYKLMLVDSATFAPLCRACKG